MDVTSERILDVMRAVRRERFVPPAYAAVACAEAAIPLGHGEWMLPPSMVGRILQAVDADSSQSVLEIGTGSGYLAACLARLAGQVTSIDMHEAFVQAARDRIEDSGIDNCNFMTMDAMQSLPDGQFDVIIATGSIPERHPAWLDHLADDGRLFVVVGEAPVMTAELVRRGDGGTWQATSLFETVLPPLNNPKEREEFTF